MGTILFDDIVFGPLHSRRLGISLGINLLPADGKKCSFDCIYCECGFNKDFPTESPLPSRQEVSSALEHKISLLLKRAITPDVITFAGNGEPTMHPQFANIIEDTISLRNRFLPDTKISVLSNALHIANSKVFNALKKIDNNILKLDGGTTETIRLIDRPLPKGYTVEKQVELFKRFHGNFILQTMFLRGEHQGKIVDNTTEEELQAWIKAIKETNPREIMIYTIDRETPSKNLRKVPLHELKAIAHKVEKLGFRTNVAG